MYIPAADTLETARVIHSFLEWSAIGFFAGVVACDVFLHLMGDEEGFHVEAWGARKSQVTLCRRTLMFTWWPACKSGLGVKGLLKTQSLVWFGLAIILEAAALPYSERIDELADRELSNSGKQIAAALARAGGANKEAGLARKTAGESDERSKKLEGSNKQIGIDLEAEKQKTARFQRDADEARLALSSQIKEQGPRWRLLKQAREELVSALLPFSGQHVGLYIAGQQFPRDEETISTWAALAESLNSDGAKWKLEDGGLTYTNDFPAQGIAVFVSTKASRRTTEAAETLNAKLRKILPQFSDRTLVRQDPDWFARIEAEGFPQGKNTPHVRAANDSNLITVLIGSHPQQEALPVTPPQH